jgi:hypothetical protein
LLLDLPQVPKFVCVDWPPQNSLPQAMQDRFDIFGNEVTTGSFPSSQLRLDLGQPVRLHNQVMIRPDRVQHFDGGPHQRCPLSLHTRIWDATILTASAAAVTAGSLTNDRSAKSSPEAF